MTDHVRIPRAFRPLAQQTRAAGWTVGLLGNGHFRWTSPEGVWVYMSASPSDRRAQWKVRAAMRRAGAILLLGAAVVAGVELAQQLYKARSPLTEGIEALRACSW